MFNRILAYFLFNRKNTYVRLTVKYRVWDSERDASRSGDFEFSDISIFKEEYQSMLSEERTITFDAELLDADFNGRLHIAPVDKWGNWIYHFFNPHSQLGFHSKHIPKEKVIEQIPLKISLWKGLYL